MILVKGWNISGPGNWAFTLRYHHEALPEHQRGKNDAAQIQHLSQGNSAIQSFRAKGWCLRQERPRSFGQISKFTHILLHRLLACKNARELRPCHRLKAVSSLYDTAVRYVSGSGHAFLKSTLRQRQNSAGGTFPHEGFELQVHLRSLAPALGKFVVNFTEYSTVRASRQAGQNGPPTRHMTKRCAQAGRGQHRLSLRMKEMTALQSFS